MRIGIARSIIGSLSFPSKLPATAYDLPAKACKTGAKLALVPGSTCNGCYALKGNYTRANAAIAFRRRLAAVSAPLWVDAMVQVLTHVHRCRIKVDLGHLGVRLQKTGGERWIYHRPGFHRWHSSGDIQSVDHLRKICEVAARTPHIRHWLPTQELAMVRLFVGAGGIIPKNLVIRVSAVMVDDQQPRAWPTTSAVHSTAYKQSAVNAGAYICPAPQQNHRCASCRACWNSNVAHVSYQRH